MEKRILFCLILITVISGCGKNKSDLINNYEERSKEIISLKEYYFKIVPSNYLVRIRYNSNRNVDLAVYESKIDSEEYDLFFQKWNIDLDNYIETPQTDYQKKYEGKTNSLELTKKKLNWNDKTFNELKFKLDNAGCIGITSGNPTEVEYGYRALAVYSYLIFDDNLDKEQQKEYSNDCNLLFYKDNVVLCYGSGAIGDDCNTEFKRKK
jgi:hypothetical protein